LAKGEVNILGLLSSDNSQLVESKSLVAATDTLSFTGLNGDEDSIYLLEAQCIGGGAALATYTLEINTDVGANYGEQNLLVVSGGVTANRVTAQAHIHIGSADNGELSVLSMLIYGLSGKVKIGILERGEQIDPVVGITQFLLDGAIYNSSNAIVQLDLKSDIANGFGIGTVVNLFALRKK
jgi:hypothetical protein